VSLTQFSVTDPLAPAGIPTTWGSSTAYGANRSDQLNFRGSVSYVTGSHNIKTGFTLMHSVAVHHRRRSTTRWRWRCAPSSRSR
jgi:hypothetical protein